MCRNPQEPCPDEENTNAENRRRQIRISVRALVEFLLRSGDIDNRIGAGAQKDAMLAGGRMHRMIQRRMKSVYQAEVFLSGIVEREDYDILIEGRADGVFPGRETTGEVITDGSQDCIFIDEIKCMYRDVTAFTESAAVHRAQAQCYAYLYARQHGCSRMGIRITYCNLDTEEIRSFSETIGFDELSIWFLELIESYQRWIDLQITHEQRRDASIKELSFPFPYRTGQEQLVKDVYRTIARRKDLFLQAPTGTGKTIAVLYPSLKAVGEGLAEKLFYLTAKTITRTVAKKTCDLLKENGLSAKVVVLTAKEKICPMEECECNPDACPYAKGHFDRINDAVYSLLLSEDDFTAERLNAYAEEFLVCPYELSLDVSSFCDVIICDYNYAFDPNVSLKRFFGESISADYIFLTDEAHNLVERARSMYSASVCKEDFLAAKKYLRDNKKLIRLLNRCNTQMLSLKRECDAYRILPEIGSLHFSLIHLFSAMDEFLREHRETEHREELADLYFSLRHFLNMAELADEHYVIYTDYGTQGDFYLHLYCVDPSANLQQCLDHARSTLFFSATLLPVGYYKTLLTTKEEPYAVYATSIFSEKQRLLLIGRDVSTLYQRRGPDEYKKMASYIRQITSAKNGNYMIYFPSYQMMRQVYEYCLADGMEQECELICQAQGMREKQREEFVLRFEETHRQTLLGFCVLGGIFSEGIDLAGDALIGVLIFGTGLPQICAEREILKDYYQKQGKNGFEYAYLIPGFHKVLQAAGRVIRTDQDIGVIALLDERFGRMEYKNKFPREWSDVSVLTLNNVREAAESFWKQTTTTEGGKQ